MNEKRIPRAALRWTPTGRGKQGHPGGGPWRTEVENESERLGRTWQKPTWAAQDNKGGWKSLWGPQVPQLHHWATYDGTDQAGPKFATWTQSCHRYLSVHAFDHKIIDVFLFFGLTFSTYILIDHFVDCLSRSLCPSSSGSTSVLEHQSEREPSLIQCQTNEWINYCT